MRKVGFYKLAGMPVIGLVFCVPFVQAQKAGSLDKTFGTGGVVTTIFNNQTMVPIGAVEQLHPWSAN